MTHTKNRSTGFFSFPGTWLYKWALFISNFSMTLWVTRASFYSFMCLWVCVSMYVCVSVCVTYIVFLPITVFTINFWRTWWFWPDWHFLLKYWSLNSEAFQKHFIVYFNYTGIIQCVIISSGWKTDLQLYLQLHRYQKCGPEFCWLRE